MCKIINIHSLSSHYPKGIREFSLGLVKKFAENERGHLSDDNLMWLKEQIFIFEDETENMC